MVKVCYFGIYRDEPRTKILVKGLNAHNIEVVECNAKFPQVNIKLNSRMSFILFHVLFSLKLLYSYFKLVFFFITKSRGCKQVIVGFPFLYDAIIAYCLCKLTSKELFVDYLMSMYETTVIDRGKLPAKALRGKKSVS